MITLTRKQVRRIDRQAIEALGIPSVVLMENAGRNAANIILNRLKDKPSTTKTPACVVILCGGGNNGGDGYVIARHLYNHGIKVMIHTTTDPSRLSGDVAIHHAVCTKMGLSILPLLTMDDFDAATQSWIDAVVIVDALLGTGFQGQVRHPIAEMIECCNQFCGKHHNSGSEISHGAGPTVVAIDVPSGLDCDNGQPSNATIRADLTVTFVANKAGFVQPTASPYVGRIVVADIGTPPELIDQIRMSST